VPTFFVRFELEAGTASSSNGFRPLGRAALQRLLQEYLGSGTVLLI